MEGSRGSGGQGRRTFRPPPVQWRNLRLEWGGVGPGHTAVKGRGLALGCSGGSCRRQDAVLQAPCRPHLAPEEGCSPPRWAAPASLPPPGTQVPFSCGKKLTACLRGQLGLVPSAVALPAAGWTIPAVSRGPGTNGSILAWAQGLRGGAAGAGGGAPVLPRGPAGWTVTPEGTVLCEGSARPAPPSFLSGLGAPGAERASSWPCTLEGGDRQ